MTTRAVASVRKFFHSYFPERHLYHRSRGMVQFIVLSAPAQIALFLLSLGFFGWVAYASVNVLFKDEIIANNEQRFRTMQLDYENRIAELQASLDEIHSALVTTQDRFASAAGELENRHRQLTEIMARHDAAVKDLGAIKARVTKVYQNLDTSGQGNRLVMSDEAASPRLRPRPEPDYQGGGSVPLSDNAEQRVSLEEAVQEDLPAPLADYSKGIAGRFGTLDTAQHSVIEALDAAAHQTSHGLERILAVTGLNVDRVLERVAEDQAAQASNRQAAGDGIGGPYVPLASLGVFSRKAKDPAPEDEAVGRLRATVDRLAGLQSALSSVPLVGPLAVDFHVASGFGRRSDPFTSQAAFHYGLDFVAKYAAPVLATSGGIVTHAGRLGPYGNLVEIDHGNGIRTRYGHLYRVSVKVGDVVKFRQQVGLLGSTGRSTGPHVHYEVRFNGTLRDPARFLEAGRYVFQG